MQDQAHAAELLMADLGKLPWVDTILEKVNIIVQASRNNRNLLSRFRDLIQEYNREVKNLKDAKKTENQQLEDVWDLMDTSELDDLEESISAGRIGTKDSSSRQAAMGQRLPAEQLAGSLRPPAQRTALTLKKTVKTRFASSETMLEGYVRSRPLLQTLVRDPEFNRIYGGSRVAGKEKRDIQFVQVIDDDSFYDDVKDLHRVLQVIRRYLRVWDAGNAQISEVVPATIILEYV